MEWLDSLDLDPSVLVRLDSPVQGYVDKAYWFPELHVQACRRRDGMQLECQESWECLPLDIRPVSVLRLEAGTHGQFLKFQQNGSRPGSSSRPVGESHGKCIFHRGLESL